MQKTSKQKKSLKVLAAPLLGVVTIVLSACSGAGSRNNARLAFGGDPMTLPAYSEAVTPLITTMGRTNHYAVTAHSASYEYKATIEENGANKYIDTSFTNINFLSGLTNVKSTTSTRPTGILDISFSGSGSYMDSSLSVHYEGGTHTTGLSEGAIVRDEHDALFYFFYQRALETSIFPYSMPVPGLFRELLFLDVAQIPVFSSTLITGSFTSMISSFDTFLKLEQDIKFNDELVGIYSYGDNVYGIGMYMDNADYTSFLSTFKTHYLETHTEAEYASNYGNFYDALNMTRFALSVIVNSNGLASFGINLDCDITEPLGTTARSDGTTYKVTDADISISCVFTVYQGDQALQIIEEW